MERVRRTELAWMAGSAVASGAISWFAAPLPPLLQEIQSPAWTRGIEFVVLLLVFLMLLSIAGVVQAKIGLGIDGVTAQRITAAGEASRNALEDLRSEFQDLQRTVDGLTARIEANVPAGASPSAPSLQSTQSDGPNA
jgi:hypothetical protein